MIRNAAPGISMLLAALLFAGCSWIGSPKYYERTKKFTKEKVEASRSFAERYIERDSLVRVKPWERDLLARPEMGLTPDPAEALRRSLLAATSIACNFTPTTASTTGRTCASPG